MTGIFTAAKIFTQVPLGVALRFTGKQVYGTNNNKIAENTLLFRPFTEDRSMPIAKETPVSAFTNSAQPVWVRNSPHSSRSMTHALRQNLIVSSRRRSYSGKNGLTLKDGHWQLSEKLARLLGVAPGTPGGCSAPSF